MPPFLMPVLTSYSMEIFTVQVGYAIVGYDLSKNRRCLNLMTEFKGK